MILMFDIVIEIVCFVFVEGLWCGVKVMLVVVIDFGGYIWLVMCSDVQGNFGIDIVFGKVCLVFGFGWSFWLFQKIFVDLCGVVVIIVVIGGVFVLFGGVVVVQCDGVIIGVVLILGGMFDVDYDIIIVVVELVGLFVLV